MFTAETVLAEEALRIGLCEAVFPDDEFFQSVETMARTIVQNSLFTHAANKHLLEATDQGRLDAGLQWEAMETEGTGPDAQERINIFLKK